MGYSDGFYTSVQKGGGVIVGKVIPKVPKFSMRSSNPGGGDWGILGKLKPMICENSREWRQEYPTLYDFDNIFPH